MQTLEDVIKFLEDTIIECMPSTGCGRCDDVRKCIEIIKPFSELEQILDKSLNFKKVINSHQ